MLPLAHRRILITRSRHQASSLAAHLEALGAVPILIPTIHIAPPESFASLDAALSSWETFDWLILTSANAIQLLYERSRMKSLWPLARLQTAAIGPATARAAELLNMPVDLIPPSAVAESLAAALIPRIERGARVLLVCAATARDLLPQALTAAGACVVIAEAYRTVIPPDSVGALRQLFVEPVGYPDAITFTSSSTATNLLALLEAAGLSLPADVVRASIGPITTQTLLDAGMPPHVEAAEATTLGLAQALAGYYDDHA